MRIDAIYELRKEMKEQSLSFHSQKSREYHSNDILAALLLVPKDPLLQRICLRLKNVHKKIALINMKKYISVILVFPAVKFPIKILPSHK